MTPRSQPVPEVVGWQVFDGHPVDALVTTRHGGVSAGDYGSLNLGLHVGDDAERVVENRRRAAAALGLALDDLVFCDQTHGSDVAVVGLDDRGRGTLRVDDAVPADAVVTTTPDVGLVVMVADCVPLVLYDPGAHILAAVHAGWRGTVARIGEAAVEAMAGLGADPARIVAGIGPAVTVDRYQVGDEVADAVRASLDDDGGAGHGGSDGDEAGGGGGAVGDVVRPDGTGRWLVDLWAANRRILVEAGLQPGNIEVSTVGTGPGTPFFSDRAARPCGRFAALARLQAR